MRHSLVVFPSFILASLLAALLSGAIVAGLFMLFADIALTCFYFSHALTGYPAASTVSWVTIIGSVPAFPFAGMVGSVLLWRMTLPFGVISACVRYAVGPSRRVSAAVGAAYGGTWAALFRGLGPAFRQHSPALVRPESLSSLNGVVTHLPLTLLYAVVGAVVGLLMPWSWLTWSGLTRFWFSRPIWVDLHAKPRIRNHGR